MQPMIRIALLLMTISTPAFAADFEFKIGRVAYTYDITTALVETANTSGKDIGLALIACVFTDPSGEAIDIGHIVISKMPAGESRHDKTFILGKHDVGKVSCKPKSVSFR
jgi:hypothetical protein